MAIIYNFLTRSYKGHKLKGGLMNKEVSNSQVLQSIVNLSDQIEDLSGQLTQTEERLNVKIGKLDAKISVLSDRLLGTQAEVKMLKNTYWTMLQR